MRPSYLFYGNFYKCSNTSSSCWSWLTHGDRDKMDDIFQTTFSNVFFEQKCMNLDEYFTEVCPKVRINNIPALTETMACRRSGDKPLSEPTMASSLTHICVIRPQWVAESYHFILKMTSNILANGVKILFAYLQQDHPTVRIPACSPRPQIW